MNFVTGLSESKDYNAILMIIDRLTKIRHYIIYKIKKEEISAEQTA